MRVEPPITNPLHTSGKEQNMGKGEEEGSTSNRTNLNDTLQDYFLQVI
jgi:hypothetical protein